jgi:Protein of unknown function (DUF4058)
MPSPFPGMDPYLEHPGWWPDFHARFIPICCDVLNEVLPSRYDARIETSTQLVEIPARELKLMEPDVYVAGRLPQRSARRQKARAGGVATLDQVTLRAPAFKEVRDHWIRVLYRPDEAVVTAIEVLSPTNKTGSGYLEYQAKRDRLLARNVHLVEINLLAGGRRPKIASAWPTGDYYALIARAEQRPVADVKCWSVRDRLPTVPVPLRAPDPDVPLDLARVFAIAYRRGRYARAIKYGVPPVAPFSPSDLTWATARARSRREV